MKTYNYFDAPLEVHGVPFFEETGKLERLPEYVRKAVPSLAFLGRRCPGARVCFRTDSPKITLRMTLETLTPDVGMAIYDCQSVNVMIGPRNNARFAGLLNPPDYNTKTIEKSFLKEPVMEEVTLWLPRNEIIGELTVSVEDGAVVAPPTPYRYPPMLYYGSSITEGACCCRVTNAYNALISQRLDVDYYNFGFSGAARAEQEIADYISTIPMSIFVMDYDHNAPNAEYLMRTHEPFFKRIRKDNPTLPVIFMSRPDFDYDAKSDERRQVIRTTYENAVAAGDENVWFIDGETFFGDTDRHACTCDCVHPNDLGFYRMASVIEPVVKKILQEKYGE